MDQISRPFQIALVAVCLFAGVWFFALHGHSSSTNSSASTTTVTASAPAVSKPASSAATGGASTAAVTAKAKAEAKSGHIYHGPVPGLEGLTRDIARAHGAVAATGESPSTPSTPPASSHSSSSATATAHDPAKTSAPAASTPTVKSQPIKAKSGAGRSPARQVLVEDALHEGKIAVILFWNSKGVDDTIVNGELRLLEAVHHLIKAQPRTAQLRKALKASGLELDKSFAAFVSTAAQVASYGSITRGVQVYGTPTVLIVNKSGKTTVLTGLQDAFSIEQAIDEARNS
jgi:hypothetical protein